MISAFAAGWSDVDADVNCTPHLTIPKNEYPPVGWLGLPVFWGFPHWASGLPHADFSLTVFHY